MEIHDFISDFKEQKKMSPKEQDIFLRIILTPPEGHPEGLPWKRSAEQEHARHEFITRNMRLAVFFVKRYCNMNDPRFTQLLSAAVEGMINALDGFKLGMNTRYSTYANFWIRARVFSELKMLEQDTRRYKSLGDKVKRCRNAAKSSGIFLDDDQIFDILGWDELKRLRHTADQARMTVDVTTVETMDSRAQHDSSILCEQDGDQLLEDLSKAEDISTMLKVMDYLPEDMVEIVKRRFGFYGEPTTYDVLSKEYGLAREVLKQKETLCLRLLWLYFNDRERFFEIKRNGWSLTS